MGKIFYHADDFGATYEQSKSILECYEHGVLNSVSIIFNSPNAARSYELIRELVDSDKIRAVVHLNFVEGYPMADTTAISHLIDERGMFNCKYGAMLKYNYGKLREEVKKEFKAEITAQLREAVAITGSTVLNIDSHQHYLQIPMIWEATCEVLSENNWTVNYIRIPVDPMGPVWSTPSIFFKVPLINHVKWALLKFLTPSKASVNSLNAKVPVFFGMPFTCQMTEERVTPLLQKYKRIADKKGTDLELMFHPGAIRNTDDLMDSTQADLVDFYGSELRDLEKKFLMNK